MILEKLKTWEYYQNKIPLFLRNSHGMDEHFKIFFDILKNCDEISDEVLSGFDLFNENYEKNYIEKYEKLNNDDTYSLDILDKIGKIYGINRYFDVKYIDENGQETTKELKLTNKELYKLILSKIILLNYDGTYSMARELYDKIGLPIYMFTDNSANVKLILDTGNQTTITQNIKDLFYANMFTLKSLGITYTIFEADISKLAIYDSTDENLSWDKGIWS